MALIWIAPGARAGARDAAAKVVRYQPQNMQSHLTLGLLDYMAGDKSAAVEILRKAKAIDPENFRRRFDAMLQRPAYKSVLDDKEFLKNLEN